MPIRDLIPRGMLPRLSLRGKLLLLALLPLLASLGLIALAVRLSVRTVEAHRQSIKRKLELEGQAELIRHAVEHGRQGEPT